MLLVTISLTSAIMAEKKSKMADFLRFFSFYINNMLCMLLMTSPGTSSMMAKKNQNDRFIAIFCILRP